MLKWDSMHWNNHYLSSKLVKNRQDTIKIKKVYGLAKKKRARWHIFLFFS